MKVRRKVEFFALQAVIPMEGSDFTGGWQIATQAAGAAQPQGTLRVTFDTINRVA